jgi:phage tail-like protein
VIFPVFDAGIGDEARVADAGAAPHLILKRGFAGSLDLYTWWNKARRGRAPKQKTLHIRLLAEDQRTVVAAWRFRAVRPVRLSYSPLRASEGGIVFETIELAFDRMEML